jgi:protein SCO1/2/putative membrane protein
MLRSLFLALFSLSSSASEPEYAHADLPVGPFTLTERSGKDVSREELKGKVWIAHFFFSQCADCNSKTLPTMRALQKTFAGRPDVMLVSISVDPADGDRLQPYAQSQAADSEQWMFLTGSEAYVHAVIEKAFFQGAQRNPNRKSESDAFIHSFSLLVIDRNGVIDGYVDGTNPEAAAVVARHVRAIAGRKYILPAVNAGLNGLCAVLLVTGYVAIRRRRETLHKSCMLAALVVSIVFLSSYLFFHFVVQDRRTTTFRGEGWIWWTYYMILWTHSVLAAAVAPLAFFVAYQGLENRRSRHVRVARWTLPIWLYVSITGVMVYVLLYEVYPPF